MSEVTTSFGMTAGSTVDRKVSCETAELPSSLRFGSNFCADIALVNRAASCGIWLRTM
ncbi:hypothetical protein D3C83_248480 [compost metagenome]